MRRLLLKLAKLKSEGIEDKILEFTKTDFFSDIQINNYQNFKLRKLIEHAYENVPYYRNVFDDLRLKPSHIQSHEDLHKLPVLEKNDIQNKLHTLKAQNIKKIYSRTTSGSTGKPSTIFYDYNNKMVEMALVQRFNNNIQNKIEDRKLLLWAEHESRLFYKVKSYLKQYIYNYKLVNAHTFTESQLENLAINLSKGHYPNLRGYTTLILMIAKKMEDLKLKVDLNSISVTSEQLFDYSRDIIVNSFGNNLYNQYGCAEANSLAFECNQHKGMHHAFEHSILEILDDNNLKSQTGNVVITNLDNYAMPLIRYKNGDIATMSSFKCSCGRNSKLIEKIVGRQVDFIKGLNGNNCHASFFVDTFFETGFVSDYEIQEFIVVQTNIDELTIEYVTLKSISTDIKKKISKILQVHLGPMKIRFNRIDKIERTASGKKKMVISYEQYLKLNS